MTRPFALRFILAFAVLCLSSGATSWAQPPQGSGDGGDRDGGGWGGRGGGWGGGGGGDPSSFLDRLDRNGNGMLDPDEMEGPAGFMIARMKRDDPSISTDKPIPISKLKEGFEKMRAARGGGGGDDRGGRGGWGGRGEQDENQRAADEKISQEMIAQPLVPGFGLPETEVLMEPLMGFGSAAELMMVEVTPADQADAEQVLRRFDRNRDGLITTEEVNRYWKGNPFDFDRNGDKKLQLNELAIRSARRRAIESSETVQAIRTGKKPGEKPKPDAKKEGEAVDLYKGRKSYMVNVAKLPDGLPGWFAARDADGDLQVSMSEYSSIWNNDIVAEYNRFDTDGDGVVTAKECLQAVESGASAATAVAANTASAPTPTTMASTTAAGTTTPAAANPAPAAAGTAPNEKMMALATRIISRNDKNGDGVLTGAEWKEMFMDISPADADKDGRITATEYATWTEQRAPK